jgi:metallo-beta-lactamase family protein
VLEIDGEGRKRRLCFSGDLGRRHLPVLRDPEPPPLVDTMIIESTYGARLHTTPETASRALGQAISRTIERGGKVIIPAFAVGRTQDIVYDLHKLIQNGDLPSLPVYVDSPLAVNVTRIFRLHPECYDQEMRQYINQREDPFGFHRLVYVRSVEESKALNRRRTPCVIVSASGMCEGGRILHHLKHNLGDARNTVLFVGFQAENTLGRKLVDGNKTVPILGEPVDVRAEISTIDGYSAHADRDEILSYLEQVRKTGSLENAYCVHGDAESCEAMAAAIRQAGVSEVSVPRLGQTVEL